VIADLQRATLSGGVHLVRTIAPATRSSGGTVSLEELRSRYKGWEVTVERCSESGRAKNFFARKGAA
jgi:hypothetical protein